MKDIKDMSLHIVHILLQKHPDVGHSTHGEINNDMGVKVDWRDVKKIVPPSSNLEIFIGSLFHFIKEIGKEHQTHLIHSGTPNVFTSTPVLSKALWDSVQEFHPRRSSSP